MSEAPYSALLHATTTTGSYPASWRFTDLTDSKTFTVPLMLIEIVSFGFSHDVVKRLWAAR